MVYLSIQNFTLKLISRVNRKKELLDDKNDYTNGEKLVLGG